MTVTENRIMLDPLSVTSLLVIPRLNGNDIGAATGFIVRVSGRNFLVTNRHVCTGTHPETGESVFLSSERHSHLAIAHHSKERLGQWRLAEYPLYSASGSPNWIEHPVDPSFDVVAIPIDPLSEEFDMYPFDLGLADTDLIPQPGMTAFIIGFPFGKTSAGCLPIWKTGHIASDPDINFEDKPILLIDATTRSGMSGSPVVLRTNGGFRTRNGNFVMSGGDALFLGVYSGRLHKDIEIGIVWKPRVVTEIIAAALTYSIALASA